MTLSIHVSSFTTVRQYDRMFFKVQGDFEPFPGALVSIDRYFRSAKRPILQYQGILEDVILNRYIPEVKRAIGSRGVLETGNVYRLTREQLSWLQEINHLINWGQSNSYNLDIGKMPDEEFQKGERCTEADFQIAKLSVSAI